MSYADMDDGKIHELKLIKKKRIFAFGNRRDMNFAEITKIENLCKIRRKLPWIMNELFAKEVTVMY